MGRSTTHLERSAISGYGSRFLRYYDGYHPTSRFFDRLIESYLRANPLTIKSGASWLEAGAGRGRLLRCARPGTSFRRYYFDITPSMLSYCTDNESAVWVLGSALRMPFKDTAFDGVAAFLGDAFSATEYFDEAYRVLKPGGSLIHVVPSAKWGHTLRRHRGNTADETVFVGRSRKLIKAPSLLYDAEELEAIIGQVGFKHVTVDELRSRQGSAQLPEEVEIVLSVLSITIDELPILLVARATR